MDRGKKVLVATLVLVAIILFVIYKLNNATIYECAINILEGIIAGLITAILCIGRKSIIADYLNEEQSKKK